MQETPVQPTAKRRFPVSTFTAVLLIVCAAGIFAVRNTIQVQYHTYVLSWSTGEFFRSIAGKNPSLVGRAFSPQQVSDMMEHHREKLVELGALTHRLYLFPRIRPSTDASKWLSHEFHETQAKLGSNCSSSGGSRDERTGKRVRSIEIWLDPSMDVAQWDAWKASVDATELSEMRLDE